MYKTMVSFFIAAGVIFLTSSFYQKYDLPKSIERGKDVYTTYCMNCHMVDGNGTPDVYPPLAKSDYLKKPVKLQILAVLNGQDGEVIVNGKKYNVLMPAQNYLTDEQVADALNYARNSWGNKNALAITPAQVKSLRK
ncbi:cytochrome c [Ferruginibacter paludis]|uniref:c-type cytochrome n=1 Tax=Ferruginibacter paludis TaxID=1310417 RepID=UPI0025B58DAD|nr:cytochrome c [Ferruginibacter paludis]MDN3655286.1 cytochrome c [Ferruginibacter paludis]